MLRKEVVIGCIEYGKHLLSTPKPLNSPVGVAARWGVGGWGGGGGGGVVGGGFFYAFRQSDDAGHVAFYRGIISSLVCSLLTWRFPDPSSAIRDFCPQAMPPPPFPKVEIPGEIRDLFLLFPRLRYAEDVFCPESRDLSLVDLNDERTHSMPPYFLDFCGTFLAILVIEQHSPSADRW